MVFQWTYCVRAWLAWLIASPLLLSVLLADFGWTGYLACFGPVLLLALGHRGASVVVWIGLTAIIGNWLFEATQMQLSSQAVTECLIFFFGVAFGERAILESVEPDEMVQPAASEKGEDTEAAFAYAVHRELGRARRHGRPFAVVSADVLPDRVNASLSSTGALQGLFNALSKRLHVYADAMVVGDRVLGLVPEVDATDRPGLERRLRHSVGDGLNGEVRMGIAFYPLNGISVDDLIESADRDRIGPSVRNFRAGDLGSREVAT